MRRFLPFVFAGCVVAIACSSKVSRPPAITDVGSSGGVAGGGQSSGQSSGSLDGGVLLDDAGVCLPGTYVIDVNTIGTLNGSLAIAGTVEPAVPIQPNHDIVFTVISTTTNAAIASTFQLTTITNTFAYRVYGLPPDTYYLHVQADTAGTPAVGEANDLDGYYDGSASGPIQDPTNARKITLTQCTPNLDFGIGIIPP